MKKYAFFALTLVLTAALLVGCGCTNQNMDNTSAPTVLPTNEEVWDTTEATTRATTEATTAPSTMSTTPGETQETMDRGNGPLEDNNTTATGTPEGTNGTGTAEGRARSAMPNVR